LGRTTAVSTTYHLKITHKSGLSIAEIAAASGVGEEAAKSRLRYAHAKLREALADG
jgi:DNA-directed RNA polymerase specialized sigma24 family protein